MSLKKRKQDNDGPKHAFASQYCLTIWRDERIVLSPAGQEKIVYFIGQQERCPKSGRLHWQAYVEFRRSQRRGMGSLPRGSYTPRRPQRAGQLDLHKQIIRSSVHVF